MLVYEQSFRVCSEESGYVRPGSGRSKRDGLVGTTDELAPASLDGSHEIAECLRAGQPLLGDRSKGSTPDWHILLNRGYDGGHNTVSGVPESIFGKRIHRARRCSRFLSNKLFRTRDTWEVLLIMRGFRVI